MSAVVLVNPLEGVHVYDVAPLAVRPTLAPGHIAGAGGTTETVGLGLTVTVTVVLSAQPPPVPTSVYVVVTAGLALTEEPIVELKPVEGFHVYVLAPLAVKVTLPPAHIAGEEGVTETTREETTLTVTVCEPTQPAALVPVTV